MTEWSDFSNIKLKIQSEGFSLKTNLELDRKAGLWEWRMLIKYGKAIISVLYSLSKYLLNAYFVYEVL